MYFEGIDQHSTFFHPPKSMIFRVISQILQIAFAIFVKNCHLQLFLPDIMIRKTDGICKSKTSVFLGNFVYCRAFLQNCPKGFLSSGVLKLRSCSEARALARFCTLPFPSAKILPSRIPSQPKGCGRRENPAVRILSFFLLRFTRRESPAIVP